VGPSDDHHCAATLRIVEHPGHYMNHEASNLLDPHSVDYWASLHRQVRDQAFVFEVDHEQVLGRVEWKDRGDRMGAARLSLEAQVGEAWQKLSTWDSVQTPRWQAYTMSMWRRCSRWRLTFVQNHGDENHLVVQAVRFVIKLPPVSPSQNVMHSPQLTKKLWTDRLFTDLEVVCGEKRFAVHRAVLAAASPVFAAMLSSGMHESQVCEISIGDADERAVQDALEYMYTGIVGENVGYGMVVLGHKYDIAGLVEFAAPVALANLTPENVVSEVRTVRAHSDDKQVGPLFEALKNKVRENERMFHAAMMGI
jgi:hypothetical protein